MRRLLGLACAVLAAGGAARAQVRSAAEFPQPTPRCMRASAGQVLTRADGFLATDGTAFEVVTAVRLRSGPLQGDVDFDRPSVSVFDANCLLVWQQTFDYPLVEAGFETLAFPGGTSVLHVAARSILEPADQTIVAEEMLIPVGRALMPFGPDALGHDRYDSSYIGPFDGGFGIVAQQTGVPHDVQGVPVWPPGSVQLYRWQGVRDPQDRQAPLAYGFAMAPEILDADALAALHLPPDRLPRLPFPLLRFILDDHDDLAPALAVAPPRP